MSEPIVASSLEFPLVCGFPAIGEIQEYDIWARVSRIAELFDQWAALRMPMSGHAVHECVENMPCHKSGPVVQSWDLIGSFGFSQGPLHRCTEWERGNPERD
jgi:hypothetical protein